MNRSQKIAANLVVVTLVCGHFLSCSGVRNRRQSLQDAVLSYSTAVRWGHVQKAARHVPEKDKAQFIARKRTVYRRLRVHEVEVRSVHIGAKQQKARVLLAMTFTISGNPVIHHHMIEQTWRHRRGGWVVVKRRRIKRKQAETSKPGDLY